jgi:hypothetical protein
LAFPALGGVLPTCRAADKADNGRITASSLPAPCHPGASGCAGATRSSPQPRSCSRPRGKPRPRCVTSRRRRESWPAAFTTTSIRSSNRGRIGRELPCRPSRRGADVRLRRYRPADGTAAVHQRGHRGVLQAPGGAPGRVNALKASAAFGSRWCLPYSSLEICLIDEKSVRGVWLSGHGRVTPIMAACAERAIELFHMSENDG